MEVRRKGREGEGTRRAVVLMGRGGDILVVGGGWVVVGDGLVWQVEVGKGRVVMSSCA